MTLFFLMGAARFLPVSLKETATTCVRLFSTSAAVLRPRIHDQEVSRESDGESRVYKRKLKLQRPTSVQYNESLRNSVSLIGEIERPLKACNSDKFGFYTLLKVQKSPAVYRDFRVLLRFWDEMAEVSVQHLKPNNLVYVSGRLRSYMKADDDGKPVRRYTVEVSEMNFVSQNRSAPADQKRVMFEQVSAEDIIQKRRDRLHLWQLFFANPDEWWDNRKCKLNPRAPDFKHKDTGEALWLTSNDPPWVNEQLRLIDSRLGTQSSGQRRNAWSNLADLL